MKKFKLPFPPSVNCLFPGKDRRYTSKQYEAWQIEAGYKINRIEPINERCILIYGLERPSYHHRDAGNYEKPITDLLVKHKIIKDDNQDHVKGIFSCWVDREGKEVEVTLVPIRELTSKEAFSLVRSLF